MKELTKPFIIVYKTDKSTIVKVENNEGITYAGGDDIGAEFDTEQELEDYISEHGLVE